MLWQTAPVADDGTHLAYLDSGAPLTDTYRTIVLVHGHTFHAPIFSRLLSLAQDQNIRVIALNRRDYIGSTMFSESDLRLASKNDETGHIAFLQARGLEIARFLCWVIEELNIPRLSVDGNSGGLSLLGWSLGNVTTLAFLAHLSIYPKSIIETLIPYMKAFFIYGSPYGFLGYPNPPDSYHPFYVPENPLHLAPNHFGDWVSGYYKHPAYNEQIASTTITPYSFVQHTPTPEQRYRVCTTDTIPADELSAVLDLIPNPRSERFIFAMLPSTLYHVANKALFPVDEHILLDIKVKVLYGLADVWLVTWGAHELEKDIERRKSKGENGRPIDIMSVEDENHFIHWDKPELFLELLSKCIQDGKLETE